MKITQVEYNVETGEQIVKEVELTNEQVLEMEQQQKVSQINERLQAIRQELQAMDYKTSKHADGEYTDEEWAKVVDTRKALRQEMRELELE